MKDEKARVLSNVPIARDVWKLDLETDMACEPGQFVEVKCGGLFLRRPISVCEARNGVLTLIYKVVGRERTGCPVLNRDRRWMCSDLWERGFRPAGQTVPGEFLPSPSEMKNSSLNRCC